MYINIIQIYGTISDSSVYLVKKVQRGQTYTTEGGKGRRIPFTS